MTSRNYPKNKVGIELTALIAEYVADDHPVNDHDVISMEPRVAERPSIYRVHDTLNVQGNPNITEKSGEARGI